MSDMQKNICSEVKPDIVIEYFASDDDLYVAELMPNLRVTFDGETGFIKSTEVIE